MYLKQHTDVQGMYSTHRQFALFYGKPVMYVLKEHVSYEVQAHVRAMLLLLLSTFVYEALQRKWSPIGRQCMLYLCFFSGSRIGMLP